MAVADVAIVGNGAVGLALGLALARRGFDVVVVGSAHRPGSASAAAGAMLGCFGEVTGATLQSDPGRARLEMAIRANTSWPAWLEGLATDGPKLQTAKGTVVVLNTAGIPELDDNNFEAIIDALRRHRAPYEDIDPRNIDWLVSTPSVRPLRAIYIADEHAIDAARLLDAMEIAFKRAGGVLEHASARAVEIASGRVRGLLLDTGTRLEAKVLVLAAGAATQQLLDTVPEVSARIPRLLAGFGTSLIVKGPSDGPPHVIRTPNRAFGCGLHVVPRDAGHLYLGASNVIQPNCSTQPVVQDVASLMLAAARQLRRDLWFAEICKTQTGNRPVSLDGFPLLGPTDVEGLWLATATNRDGLHLAPYLASHFASALDGGGYDDVLKLFAPQRPPFQVLTRDDSVRSAALQTLAVGHEGGWNVPLELTKLIEQQLIGVFAALAERVSDRFTPPPEILSAARNSEAVVTLLRNYYSAVDTAG